MGDQIIYALLIIIRTFFYLVINLILLRFLFQTFRLDFYNPISQQLVKITNPLLVPLRRYIPGYGGVDIASVVLLLSLQCFELALENILIYGKMPLPISLLVLSFSSLLTFSLNIFFYSLLFISVASWLSPATLSKPLGLLAAQLIEPILKPARRLIPPMGGVDVSPIIAMLLLKLTDILFIQTLNNLVRGM